MDVTQTELSKIPQADLASHLESFFQRNQTKARFVVDHMEKGEVALYQL